jgi:hypothetical protein
MKVKVTSTNPGVGQLFAATAREFASLGAVVRRYFDGLADPATLVLYGLNAAGDAAAALSSAARVVLSAVTGGWAVGNHNNPIAHYTSERAAGATSRYNWSSLDGFDAEVFGPNHATILGSPMSLLEFVQAIEAHGGAAAIVLDQTTGFAVISLLPTVAADVASFTAALVASPTAAEFAPGAADKWE